MRIRIQRSGEKIKTEGSVPNTVINIIVEEFVRFMLANKMTASAKDTSGQGSKYPDRNFEVI